jgi:hypothetical protein
MSTKLSITLGGYAPGRTPTFTSRTIVYTDLVTAMNTVTSMLTNGPLLPYLPIPDPEPEPEPIVEEPIVQ